MVGEAELERLLRTQELVLPQGVEDDQLHRGLRADEAGCELSTAPGRDDRQEHLGKADVTNVRRDRPNVAMQGELEAAAESGAVDGGHGRKRQGTDSSEELVAGTRSLERSLGRRDLRELVDVCADAEDERLAGEHHRRPVA